MDDLQIVQLTFRCPAHSVAFAASSADGREVEIRE